MVALGPSRARLLFGLASIGIVAGLLIAVGSVFGINTAIQGSYVLIALILALLLYDSSSSENNSINAIISTQSTTKIVLILFFLSITLALTFSTRWFILIGTLPLGYFLVIHELRSTSPSSVPHILLQLVLLYLIPLVTKFIQSGVYFGNGDLLKHAAYVDRLWKAGSIEAIGTGYADYPGYHILVGTFHEITEISLNTSIMTVGIVLYSGLGALLVYKLFRITLSQKMALYGVVAFTILFQVTYYAQYFFPQSLSVLLILSAFYAGASNQSLGILRAAAVASILILSAIFVHHFTFILMTPIVLFVAIESRLLGGNSQVAHPKGAKLILMGFMGALSYWALVQERFISVFVVFGTEVLLNLIPGGSDAGGSQVYYFGTTPKTETHIEAVLSLLSIEGIYFIGLAFLVFVYLQYSLQHQTLESLPYPYIFIGIISVGVILKTPVSVKSLGRMAFPLAIFFSATIGYGLYAGLENENLGKRAGTTFLILLMVLAGAGMAGEDITTNERVAPYEFSSIEYSQMEAVGDFATLSNDEPTTAWATQQGFLALGYSADTRIEFAEKGVKYSDGLFIFRNDWYQYRLQMVQDGTTTRSAIISKGWLSRSIYCSNKVYDNGNIGVVWSENNGYLGC